MELSKPYDMADYTRFPQTELDRCLTEAAAVGRPAGLGAAAFEDTAEFWRGAIREPVSADPDKATAQVIARMAGMARSSAGNPLFRKYAQAAVNQHQGGLGWFLAGVNPFTAGEVSKGWAVAESIWWWAKNSIEFEHHAVTFWRRLGEVDQWQLLISPDVLVRQRPMKGDCAIFSTLIAAMLEAWGVRWEFVTVAADRSQPSVYSHVWVRAILADGSRLSLDASHGGRPGWQVPAHDIFRLQVWDMAGRPVDVGPVVDRGTYAGLQGYTFGRGLGAVCGTDPSSGEQWCDYSQGGAAPPAGSSSGGTNWGGLFANLATQWTQIGGRVLAPQTTYSKAPGGAIQYATPGAGSGSGLFSFSNDSGVGLGPVSPLVWLGGGLAVAVLFFAFSSRGRG